VRLVDEPWPSGRYRVEDLLERADPEPGQELVAR
jgi:hypothetical protein